MSHPLRPCAAKTQSDGLASVQSRLGSLGESHASSELQVSSASLAEIISTGNMDLVRASKWLGII